MLCRCDGQPLDLEVICKACRDIGAVTFLDGTQSIGVVPFSVKKVKPDYLAVAGYKWLCCPYGTAFLYVAPDRHNLQPLEQHLLARKNAGFEHDGCYDLNKLAAGAESTDYRPGALRYDCGERSTLTIPMAIASLERIAEMLRTDAMVKHTGPLTARLRQAAASLGMVVPDTCSPHIVGIGFADGSGVEKSALKAFVGSLAAKGIIVSLRGTSIRVSPGIFSTRQDIDRLVIELGKFLETARALEPGKV